MTYGIELWVGPSEALKVFSIRRRAIRIIKQLPYQALVWEHLVNSGS